MTNDQLVKFLHSKSACHEAMLWLGVRDLTAMWNECDRGDWLLWYCTKIDVERRLLVIAACKCARLALPHVKAGELRPLHAIEIAESWARGEASIMEVRTAYA